MPENELIPENTEIVEKLPDNDEFKKAVEDSKKRIAAEAQLEQPKKRGRGRPPKNKPQAEAFPSSAAQTETAFPPQPAPDLSIFLIHPIKAVSKIPAIKYQIPELALTDDEANACAQSLNQVVQAFVPDIGNMSPKTAAVVTAIATIGSIGFQKYSIYRARAVVETPMAKEDKAQKEVAKAQENNPVRAEDYFTREAAT